MVGRLPLSNHEHLPEPVWQAESLVAGLAHPSVARSRRSPVNPRRGGIALALGRLVGGWR
jgi:hypothetical protein